MPHKRNPVACMVALAAAQRAPQRVAAMAMAQEHERTQTMQPDLQFSDAVYGLGAGIFFFTCLIFEVPSN